MRHDQAAAHENSIQFPASSPAFPILSCNIAPMALSSSFEDIDDNSINKKTFSDELLSAHVLV